MKSCFTGARFRHPAGRVVLLDLAAGGAEAIGRMAQKITPRTP